MNPNARVKVNKKRACSFEHARFYFPVRVRRMESSLLEVC